jgi:DNA-binding helix-hairpin-helix protein with protein kinase domain
MSINVRCAGQFITLTNQIGSGGEGDVYQHPTEPAQVIKLFKESNRSVKAEKVAAMLQLVGEQNTGFATFPLTLVMDHSAQVVGYAMPKVMQSEPINDLLSNQMRKKTFPDSDYRFLVRVALNTARAVATIHKFGCVIGDINSSGIFVSQSGLVTLIDADSFQFSIGGRVFPCTVGTGEYTPPELQGVDFRQVERTQDHDAFGLATMLFQILALGRHPFAGVRRAGEGRIEDDIKSYDFAYSVTRTTALTAPPKTKRLTDTHPELAKLFEATFDPVSRGKRPSAVEWVQILEMYEQSLQPCWLSDGHFYSNVLRSCPWCRLEGELQNAVFYTNADLSLFVAKCGRQIDATKDGLKLSAETMPRMVNPLLPGVQEDVVKRAKLLRGVKTGVLSVVGLSEAIGFLNFPQLFLAELLVGAAAVGITLFATSVEGELSRTLKSKRSALSAERSRWALASGVTELLGVHQRLDKLQTDLLALPGLKQVELDAMVAERRLRQLESHMRGAVIREGMIAGIGPVKVNTLASHGIVSAFDVSEAAVTRISGFGPATTSAMMEWRSSVEGRFVFRHAKTKSDELLEQQITTRYRESAIKLQKGIAPLEAQAKPLTPKVKAALELPNGSIEALHREIIQLEKNLAAVKAL